MRVFACFSRVGLACAFLAMSGCAASRPQVNTDLQAGLEVAASLEAVYASLPSADPKVVSEVSLLLAAARAAVSTYVASSSPANEAAAESALAAVMAYASAAGLKP